MNEITPSSLREGAPQTRRARAGLARAALLSAGITIAVGLGVVTASAQDTKVVRYVGFSEPKTLDPVANWLAVTFEHGYMVYDTLFARDSQGRPQPQMVETWEVSDDKAHYTFTLRDGLTFHDGSPVEAADAVASIERWAQKDSAGKKLVEFGMKTTVIDAKTFEVTLDTPALWLLNAFAKPTTGPLFVFREEEARKFKATEPVDTIIGSGPFKFLPEEHRPGSKLVYAKNEDYVPRDEPADYLSGGKKVHIDRVEWIVLPDASSAINALVAGEVDIVQRPSLDLLPILEASPDVGLQVNDEQGMIGFLRMNHTQRDMDSQAARRAVALAIDQKDFLRSVAGVSGEFWSECYSFFGCGGRLESTAGMEDLMTPDPEKAKALMKEAGFTGEPIAVLGASDSTVLKEFAVVLAENMQSVGMNVDLRMSDIASMLGSLSNRDAPEGGGWSVFPMTAMAFTFDDPIGNFWLQSKCEENPFKGWPCNAHMEELLAAWARETDEEKAMEITRQIQKAAAEDLPIVPLGQFRYPVAHRTSVSGMLKAPMSVFWNIDQQM
ncbi:ABC transporter substrate-binding protein [Aquicoccus porphyridii]|uniref:ABC transporter substrate-binding protein n=1 Tax=Aquicoccus porphyridii TaxID=1852029 RepID=A0A5A9YYW4_9RHOB|nr:ABC transporter substrate-binding protein [Aquicoccus porphyridii]KAA0910017.1 ABC transporter substrate-binding protein [Aquicoccus porphyridii]RAI52115.1 ABC transporter substrate-binding protein [Rhodobacteraceae bacterium AsT-22]